MGVISMRFLLQYYAATNAQKENAERRYPRRPATEGKQRRLRRRSDV